MLDNTRYDDEISLIDLWNLVVRRKWYVIVVTVICVVAGAAYVLTQKKVYSSKVEIALAGTVPVDEPDVTLFITNPEVLSKRLKAEEDSVGSDPVAWVEEVDTSAKDHGDDKAGVLSVVVNGDSPERAHGFAERIAKELVGRQNAAIGLRRNQLTSYRQGLEGDLKSARALLAQLQRGQASDTLSARAALIQSSADLQSKIDAADQQRSETYLRNAEILSGPTMDRSPVEPKTKLILALALVGGLLLGFLLSVFVEFLGRARTRVA